MTRRPKPVERPADERLALLQVLKERLRNETRPDPSDPSVGHVQDMHERFPLTCIAMHAHLMEGGPEKGATVTIWGSEDGLGGVFSISSLGIKMFFTACALQDAFLQIEDALGDPEYKWKRETQQRRSHNGYGKSKGRSS